jgi:hypothetical protein
MNRKNIISFIFFGASIVCMEQPEQSPPKQSLRKQLSRRRLSRKQSSCKQSPRQQLSCEQLSCSMMLLTKEIAQNKIAPFLSLQSIGRIRNASKECNDLYNVVRICPLCNASKCLTPACCVLAKNYYACTKALAHCAQVGDEVMFQHWWGYHAELRNQSLSVLLKHDDFPMEERMKAYAQYYDTPKKIRKIIFKDIQAASDCTNFYNLRTLLVGSNLNIFDLNKECYGRSAELPGKIESVVEAACLYKEISFLRLLSGGTIDSGAIDNRLIQLIMTYGSSDLVSELIKIGALGIDIVDSFGKTLLHYVAEYNLHELIMILPKKGISVNSIDAQGMTPLHYAVKNRKLESVKALLESNDVDVFVANKWGKMAFAYASRVHWESDNEKAVRQRIKALLKSHIK